MSDRLDDFPATYRQMVDDQLLELASQPEQLTPEARRALWAELGRRGITEEALKTRNLDVPQANPPNTFDLPGWRLFGTETPTLPSSESVAVFSAQNESEAERVEGLLRDAGIESQLQIVILVSQTQAERALQIVSEQLENDQDAEEPGK